MITRTLPTPSRDPEDAMILALTPWVQPLGYQIIHAVLQHTPKVLRLFIDHLELPLETIAENPGAEAQKTQTAGLRIGIEDCTRVSKALDIPLETDPSLQEMFPGAFELEVSSPGIDRPLRKPADFQKYAGETIRINTFRPLTALELNNVEHAVKNAKQKNFLGILLGFQDDRVQLQNLEGIKTLKKAKSRSTSETTNSHEERITIPLQLISKANLEPDFSKIVSHEERE